MFFILGRGRSGTTLLSRMLGMHDNIVVAPEGFFAMNLWRRYGRKPFTEAQVDDFCRDLLRENRMQTWNLDTTDVAIRLRSALSAMHGAVSYSRACELVYESYAHVTLGKVSARLFGDKNPHYALLVERLLKTFPHARFLHMVRDPRDNILSYKSVPFDVNDSRALAYRWRAYNLRLLRAQAAAPDRFLQVRFEDLLANADAELGRVCEFLGIAYEPSMLSFFEESPVDFYGQGSA